MTYSKHTKQLNRALHMACLPVLLMTVSGCAGIEYYSQIVSGPMRIVMGKQPVNEVTTDESVDEGLRRRLTLALQARDFAIDTLSLPDNESYTTFYDTKRSFVTWNVVAAQEFSFSPKRWCFPVAGCVSYRGYYAHEDATAYAKELDASGLDVAINGATAYSTLGWFADPLLNTMLNRSDTGIVSLLIHELAHQQLYVGDDSTFNESFASFVEQAGLALWQQQHGSTEQLAELTIRRKRQEDFIALLRSTRNDLQVLFDSAADETMMRQKKAERFTELRNDYETLKRNWGGYRGYDAWFGRELNNARLVSVATYNDYIPAFQALFEQSNQDFPTFYAAAQELADLPAAERTIKMRHLLDTGRLDVTDSSQSL